MDGEVDLEKHGGRLRCWWKEEGKLQIVGLYSSRDLQMSVSGICWWERSMCFRYGDKSEGGSCDVCWDRIGDNLLCSICQPLVVVGGCERW